MTVVLWGLVPEAVARLVTDPAVHAIASLGHRAGPGAGFGDPGGQVPEGQLTVGTRSSLTPTPVSVVVPVFVTR